MHFPALSKRTIGVTFLSLALAACATDRVAPTAVPDTPENVQIRDGVAFTPSGAVFPVGEWSTMDHTPYLVPAAEAAERTQATALQRASGALRTLVGATAPAKVLCHVNASVCNQIPGLIPGTLITFWTDAQWNNATVADFTQFNMIYINDAANTTPAIVNNKAKWSQAITGRVALTSVHYEHCSAASPGTGPCIVLKSSTLWVTGGTGTGLLSSTQPSAGNWLPTTGVFAGVSYGFNGGGFDLVHITDPGHATMAGSTDASLSNFGQSAHSYFNGIGSFTQVAEVCKTQSIRYPTACPSSFAPNFLVTSVAIRDADGDGVPDAQDNCPTVANSNQADANGNGVGDACESAPTVTVSPATDTVAPGTPVTFTAAAADADNTPSQLTYEWRVNGLVQAGQTTSTFTTTVTANTTVRVTVRDPGNLSGFAEAAVAIITNRPPTAAFAATFGGNEGAAIPVTVSAADPDAGDVLTYKWDIDGDNVVDSTTTTPTITLTYGDQGTHPVNVTVTDGKGGSASANTTITVTNVAPTVDPIAAPASAPLGSPTTISGTFTDPGSNDGPFTASINWGDNTTNQAIASGNTFSATHLYATIGHFNVTVTVTDKDGGVSTTAATVATIADVTPPVITPTVSGQSGANGWYTGDVSVSWATTDAESGISTANGCDASTLSSNTSAAGTTYTCSATNGAGLTSTQSVTVKRDATAPAIAGTVNGTLGAAGWYTSDVAVTWSVTDAESGVSNSTGCDALNVSSNTAGTTITCTATNAAGLSATKSVSFKRDANTPVVTPSVVGTMGNNGWFTSNVNVSWSVTNLGPSSATANCFPATLSNDSPSTAYSCTATSGAGLSTSQSVTVKRDATKPAIGYAGALATYTVDQTVNITCAASDAMSGLASNSCAPISGPAYNFIGLGSYSASATDNAGNGNSASVSFTVNTLSCQAMYPLITRFVSGDKWPKQLAGRMDNICDKMAKHNPSLDEQIKNFVKEAGRAQDDGAVSATNAATLIRLVNLLNP